MKIGQKIKKLRELKNLTQEHMAMNLKLTQSAYSKIESGGDILYSKIEQIAGIFELQPEDIIGFNETLVFNMFNNKKANGLVINNISKNEKRLYDEYIETLKQEISYLKKTLDTVLQKRKTIKKPLKKKQS